MPNRGIFEGLEEGLEEEVKGAGSVSGKEAIGNEILVAVLKGGKGLYEVSLSIGQLSPVRRKLYCF